MDLPSDNSCQLSGTCEKMQLREDENTAAVPDSPVKLESSAGVEKCKVYVNGAICSDMAKELDGDKTCIMYDKADNATSLETCKEMEANGCSGDISHAKLIHRIESLDLNTTSSTCNRKIASSDPKLHNGSRDIESRQCDASLTMDVKVVPSESVLEEDSGVVLTSDLPFVESVALQDECEVLIVPKSSSPDSGLSAVSQESDGACSPVSNPSSDGIVRDMKSGAPSCDSNDSCRDFNENLLDSLCPDLTDGVSLPENMNVPQVYEFEIPQDLCGLLIGRNGRHVKFIKETCNTNIYIKQHPYYDSLKTCSVSGTSSEITHALQLIRERFPEQKYPQLTLSNISFLQRGGCLPVTMRLALPDGVTFEVILASVVNPGHFFVHQPTHPTYHTLSYISNSMSEVYNKQEAPKLIHFNIGYIVAAPIDGGGWYRAEIVQIDDECKTGVVKLLDFGGFVSVELEDLRQLSAQFLNCPFQAAECLMGDIIYPEGEEWSEEAKSAFEELSQGQILHSYIVGYHPENGLPYVHLYRVQGAYSTFINEELVNRGYARWLEEGEVVD